MGSVEEYKQSPLASHNIMEMQEQLLNTAIYSDMYEIPSALSGPIYCLEDIPRPAAGSNHVVAHQKPQGDTTTKLEGFDVNQELTEEKIKIMAVIGKYPQVVATRPNSKPKSCPADGVLYGAKNWLQTAIKQWELDKRKSPRVKIIPILRRIAGKIYGILPEPKNDMEQENAEEKKNNEKVDRQ
ncbi:hypothetical protein BDF14DRAFT_599429 [Spinellus fusiger]|nr:hypothetical protein BDF14DRAFT_599429 [Spinellus fusiger]